MQGKGAIRENAQEGILTVEVTLTVAVAGPVTVAVIVPLGISVPSKQAQLLLTRVSLAYWEMKDGNTIVGDGAAWRRRSGSTVIVLVLS